MQFPDGPFKIKMIRGVFGIGRRIDEGETLRVPQDISRDAAIRWCTRRKPFAKLVQADAPAKSGLRNVPEGYKVDVSAAQEEMPSEPPEGHLDSGTYDDPEASIPEIETGNAATHDDSGANVPDLEALSYKELQDLAKKQGVKANQTRSALIKALS